MRIRWRDDCMETCIAVDVVRGKESEDSPEDLFFLFSNMDELYPDATIVFINLQEFASIDEAERWAYSLMDVMMRDGYLDVRDFADKLLMQ